MTSLTKEATVPLGVKPRDADRSKNFFALGLICWVYSRPIDQVLAWIDERFAGNDLVRTANRAAFQAGWNFGETTEVFDHQYEIKPAELPARRVHPDHRQHRLAWGLVAAGQQAKLPVFLGSYPITPASDILHELAKHKNFGVRTLQAEDEIAAVGTALGAAFAGHLGVTTTSGPGLALKSETISLAVSLELPLARHRHPARRPLHRPAHQDRGGRPQPGPLRPPRRGAAAGGGRVPAVALLRRRHRGGPHRAQVPDAGDPAVGRLHRQRRRAVAAARRRRAARHLGALRHRAQPRARRRRRSSSGPTCAIPRRWPARGPSPARPGSMHRVGGIEKEDGTGNISYEPENHERMVHLRAAKVAGIADDIPPAEVRGDRDADLLVVGWGSTWAAIDASVERLTRRGTKVAWVHLVHLNPLPTNLGEIVRRYRHVVVPEMNLGQLCRLLRAEYLVDAKSITKVQGVPFTALELGAGLRRGAGRQERNHERHHRPHHHQEGLDQRPGGPLVPRLRRLRHPHRGADADARAGRAARAASCSCRASAARAASRTT